MTSTSFAAVRQQKIRQRSLWRNLNAAAHPYATEDGGSIGELPEQ
jgi:hypothetical protein